MYYVYIIENPSGRFYTGQTDNIERRIQQHNDPEEGNHKYTHKSGPWCLVHLEQYETRSEAMRREKFIKSRKSAQWIRENILKGRASPDVHRD